LFDSLALGPILDSTTRLLRHGQPLSERVFPGSGSILGHRQLRL
jgi:hypothetical protein